jgi:septal ring factor EnvC (AmiA/AmiB activator)
MDQRQIRVIDEWLGTQKAYPKWIDTIRQGQKVLTHSTQIQHIEQNLAQLKHQIKKSQAQREAMRQKEKALLKEIDKLERALVTAKRGSNS